MRAGDLPESARSSGWYKVQAGRLIQARARAIPLEANARYSRIDSQARWSVYLGLGLGLCIYAPSSKQEQ